MKRFTLATLAVLLGASSILAISPNANAESREDYCRNHRCDGYNRNSDRHYNRDRGTPRCRNADGRTAYAVIRCPTRQRESQEEIRAEH